MKVRFLFQKHYSITNRQALKSVIEKVFKTTKKESITIDIIICTDAYLLEINKKFLKHDYYTDIITFDLSIDKQLIGELYISIDRVKENSRINKTRLPTELARVIIHGCLHLTGLKDKSLQDKVTMRRFENKFLHYLVPRNTVS